MYISCLKPHGIQIARSAAEKSDVLDYSTVDSMDVGKSESHSRNLKKVNEPGHICLN